jgi:hypothetical protein
LGCSDGISERCIREIINISTFDVSAIVVLVVGGTITRFTHNPEAGDEATVEKK